MYMDVCGCFVCVHVCAGCKCVYMRGLTFPESFLLKFLFRAVRVYVRVYVCLYYDFLGIRFVFLLTQIQQFS